MGLTPPTANCIVVHQGVTACSESINSGQSGKGPWESDSEWRPRSQCDLVGIADPDPGEINLMMSGLPRQPEGDGQ